MDIPETLYKNLITVFPDFFNEQQIKEVNLLLKSYSITNPQIKNNERKEKDFKITAGVDYRTVIDILISYASDNLTKDRFLSFLLFISQLSILNGEFNTAIEINKNIISNAIDDDDFVDLLANAYLLIAEIYSRQAAWQESFNFISKAQEIFNSKNDIEGLAKCENLLGTIYGDLGDIKKAINSFETALSNSVNLSNYDLSGKVEINLGIVSNIKGLYNDALVYLNRALLNFERIGDIKRIAELHQNIGMVYTKQKKFDFALKEFDKSFSYATTSNYLQVIGVVYLSKSFIYNQLADYILADAIADKSLEIAHKINDKLTIADAYKIKGSIQRNLKNYSLSENFLQSSLRLNIETGNKLNEAETYHELGLLFKDMRNNKESKKYLNLSLEYFKSINADPDIEMLENLLLFNT